jgi:hypothetical protein
MEGTRFNPASRDRNRTVPRTVGDVENLDLTLVETL